ncbi:MAG: outer membrane beta-barrel protein [Bacteroidia bacterium]
MDDKQFDRLLKEKLDSFHDTGPLDAAGMGNVFSRVDAIGGNTPWYVLYKPYLVAAGISLLVVSSAFAWWVYKKQDARIEALEKQVVDLKENSGSDFYSPTPVFPKSDSLHQQRMQKEPLSPENTAVSPVFHSNPNTFAYQSIFTHDSSHKKNEIPSAPITSPLHNRVSSSRTEMAFYRLSPPIHLLTPASPLKIQLGVQPFSEEAPFLAEESQKTAFASSLRVGVTGSFMKSIPDIGRAKGGFSPGPGLEFALTDHFRLNVMPSFSRRTYSVKDPLRFRPQLNHYPRLPNLNETQVSEIEVVSRMVRVPLELNYVLLTPEQRVRPYVGAGLVGNLLVSQNFAYRRMGNDFHPGARVAKKSFAIAGISGQAGLELRTGAQTFARLGVFYEQPLKSQGAEQRRFSTAGVSASFWFAGS